MLFLVHCGMAPLCIADDNAILSSATWLEALKNLIANNQAENM